MFWTEKVSLVIMFIFKSDNDLGGSELPFPHNAVFFSCERSKVSKNGSVGRLKKARQAKKRNIDKLLIK